MTIEQLPNFTVHRIDGGCAFGSFDQPLWIGERHLGNLLMPDGRFLVGRFINVDLEEKTAIFLPLKEEEAASLTSGAKYPRFDGYWGERAALVLDRHRHWNERTFEPVAAVISKGTGFFVLSKSTNQAVPEGGAVIEFGWDHEHCCICWQTISPQPDVIAMFSEPDHWMCRKCFEQFVIPRSLDFIHLDEAGH